MVLGTNWSKQSLLTDIQKVGQVYHRE